LAELQQDAECPVLGVLALSEEQAVGTQLLGRLPLPGAVVDLVIEVLGDGIEGSPAGAPNSLEGRAAEVVLEGQPGVMLLGSLLGDVVGQREDLLLEELPNLPVDELDAR